MNGTKRFLDTDVMFFSPLVEYGAIPDQADYLFYLKNGQADDGSKCFRLMGMQSKGYKNYIIRDYDVPMYAESFKIVTVDDGSEYGITYLYWTASPPASITPAKAIRSSACALIAPATPCPPPSRWWNCRRCPAACTS